MQRNNKTGISENISLIDTIKIDKEINSFRSFIVLLFYRIQHYFYIRKNVFMLHVAGGIKEFFFFFLRIDAQIFYPAQIGHHIKLPHSAMGVVISPKAIVGNFVTIFHQVTLGINERKPETEQKIVIKDNCVLSVGCKVISCVISENCKNAPNTCVYNDLPENTICYTLCETKLLTK